MKTKQCSKNNKNKYLAFMDNKRLLVNSLLIVFFTGVLCFLFAYWTEMPVFIKIFWPILSLIAVTGAVMTIFNGMYINKKGTVVFVPDLIVKKFRIDEIKTMTFNFNEWKNSKYFVKIEIVFQDGKVFTKDYSVPYKQMKIYKLGMALYTIKRDNVDKIIEQLSNYDFCTFNFVNQCGIIAQQ